MKKILKSVLFAALGMIGLASCEDVPAPYVIPGLGGGSTGGDTTIENGLPYSSTSLNTGWTTQAANGKGNPWSQGNSYTQATGYQKWDGAETKSNRETEGYLVSPSINTTAASGKVKMSYEYCVGYANNDAQFADHIKVFASSTYTEGDFNAADWTELDWKATFTSTDWTLKTEEVQLPEAFVNQENVHIAFWFCSPADKSCTFELKTFKVEEGEAAGSTPDTPAGPITGENLLVNGDFETWEGGLPVNWKSASTASNATLSQSTEAHAGSYAVSVGFHETQNKRLAYKELTLKPGTYEWSFYAKATTANPSQCQGGYVPVNNGTADSQGYKYMGYQSLNNTEWTLVSGTFTLEAPTTVCLLVMNPKTSSGHNVAQEILIDDASLKTNDGGLVDGTEPETPDTPDTPLPSGTNVTAAEALAVLAAMQPAAQTSEEYVVSGKVASVTEISTQFGNATVVLEGGLTLFRFKSFGGANFTDADAIKVGDEIEVKGYLKNYVKDDVVTPELVNGTMLKLNGKTEADNAGGNEQPETPDTPDTPNTPDTPDTPSGGKVVTFTAGVDKGSLTSDSPGADQVTKDGVTISVTNGCLGNTDNYRTYKSQSMTVSAASAIASIEFTCTANGDTKYGPGCWTADKGTYTYSEKTGTWTGDATSITFSATSNQVRATKIVVTLK